MHMNRTASNATRWVMHYMFRDWCLSTVVLSLISRVRWSYHKLSVHLHRHWNRLQSILCWRSSTVQRHTVTLTLSHDLDLETSLRLMAMVNYFTAIDLDLMTLTLTLTNDIRGWSCATVQRLHRWTGCRLHLNLTDSRIRWVQVQSWNWRNTHQVDKLQFMCLHFTCFCVIYIHSSTNADNYYTDTHFYSKSPRKMICKLLNWWVK